MSSPVPTPENPDPANAICISNFASYYGPPGGQAPPREFFVIAPKYAKDPLKNANTLTEIIGVLQGYGKIPDEERDHHP